MHMFTQQYFLIEMNVHILVSENIPSHDKPLQINRNPSAVQTHHCSLEKVHIFKC